MTNQIKIFTLPGTTAVTYDIDEHLNAWKELAAPIETELGLTLCGFDPDFFFRVGNPHGISTTIQLPTWFVQILSQRLNTST